MTIEFYKRDFDQNEDLGLNDMIVEVRSLSSPLSSQPFSSPFISSLELTLLSRFTSGSQGYEGEKEAQDAFAASVLAAGAKKLTPHSA